MEAQKAKKKATNKELTNAVIDINQRINHMYNMIRGFDSIFTIYLEEKGDKEMLEKKLDELQKEQEKKNEQEKNGKADKPNLQGDTDGESSGTKGVRKAGK
jgi:stringent starvation protein B|tara:strand:+ start:500 stop:802 length:303 start_codon:yes stop_codon:yes gene_type:complete